MRCLFRISFVLFIFFLSTFKIDAQILKKVLFLGNSYTQANNLPQMIADIAHSAGDSLFYDFNTPGGYTFEGHSINATSLSKISSNNWNYVVLQEQSQLPSFPPSQVQTEVYPYADSLNSKIKKNDSCTKTLFYMTWGRKNGDAGNCASYPPVCTYLGMQQRLKESYLEMANALGAEVCPAGIAWKHFRQTNPLVELYQADESHPTVTGTYLVACTFYASVFHKSPVGLFIPSGITASLADTIQRTAYNAVFDSLTTWRIDTLTVKSCFTSVNVSNNTYQFSNCSQNANSYFWKFGDGSTSSDISPIHNYLSSGNYNVMLVASNSCAKDSLKKNIDVVSGIVEAIDNKKISVFPVPAEIYLNILCPESNIHFPFAEIFDYKGCFVRKVLVENNTIDIKELSSGYYILRLTSSQNTYCMSFVKM
jgi:hypothetical protein